MPDKRERPADFEERAAAGMTFAQLRAHYSCGKGTLARWFAEGPPPRASLRGKHLPGAVAALTPDQARDMTARRWKTRKDRYGPSGHRKGAASPSNPENEQ